MRKEVIWSSFHSPTSLIKTLFSWILLGRDIDAYLRAQGLQPYFKKEARVVELAKNCDELLKPLLNSN
ncbi:MAG: hypothetical protein RMJ66_05455 [Bacteroidia bacterium]|nr:hypothetical protein [Bacteroidia bacterium]MDW8134495.1 hypothetical protein [Bacteroidia bacterium]